MYRDIPSTIDEVVSKIDLKLNHIQEENYNPGSIPILKLKNWIRESYQDLHREQIKIIISKLKQRIQLTTIEMEIMEQFMIGDLKNYTKIVDHYQQWISSLKENIEHLQSLNIPNVHLNSDILLEIQGIIIEMEHILFQIDQFQYTIERIKRYKKFVGIDILDMDDTKRFELARILQEMINSPLH